MNEIVIKKHSFELAKNRLKEFSENNEAKLAIEKVETDGGFLGLGDHKVTGNELNNRIETIQNHLININSINNKTIKEFREIYNALDALDKDYMTSIVASVKAIEKTSNDVRIQQGVLNEHNSELQKQQNKLDCHQVEIDKIVDNIKKTVTALKLFKEKLDGFKHLADIDKIWTDCKVIHNEIQVISDSITKLSNKTTSEISATNSQNKIMIEQVNQNINLINNNAKLLKDALSKLATKVDYTAELLEGQILIIQDTSYFVNQMRNIEHLNEVDLMWDDINEGKENFNSIKKGLENIDDDISKVQGRINVLDDYVAVLRDYVHLSDIDNMWTDLVDVKTDTKNLFKNMVDINDNIQRNKDNLDILNNKSIEHKKAIDELAENQSVLDDFAKDNRQAITELEMFREKVDDIEHLNEVDLMWKQGNLLQDGLSIVNNDIASLQQKAFETEESFAEYKSQTENVLAKFEKKIKYAYLIAGGSLGFAIMELVLIMFGVI